MGFLKVYKESTDEVEEDDVTHDFKGKIPTVGDVVAMDRS